MKKSILFFVVVITTNLSAQRKWSLEEAINYAIEHNVQIRQNSLNNEVQNKNLDIAKREKLPSVAGSIGNTLNLGQSQDVFGTIRRNDNFNNNAGVSANVLVYNHNRLNKSIEKAQFDVEASHYDVETIKNNISLQIIQQYLSILLSKEILKVNESAYENARKVFERAKITTEVGTTPQTILAEAEASVAREQQNLNTAKINIQRNLFQLSQILQLKDYQDFDVQDIPEESIFISKYGGKENMFELAYDHMSQIKSGEARIAAAKAQTEIVKTAFWPTITAGVGAGTFYFNSLVANNLQGLYIRELDFFQQYKNNFGQQVMLNLNIPIFNKGITKIQVEQAKISEEIAKANLEQQKVELRQNVQRAEFDVQANYENYLAAQKAEANTKLALDFAEKSFTAGRSSIYDLTIARNNYTNAKGSLVQSKYNYFFSKNLLEFYIGEFKGL